MKKMLLLLTSFILVIALTACNGNDDDFESIIYVTVYPVQYLVESIAGETVEIKRVPGSNVHSTSYDWSAKEIIDMQYSDLLFYINGGVDTYIENNLDSTFSEGDVQLVDMSQHIEYNLVCYAHSHDEDDDHESTPTTCDENSLSEDPHFWLDPVRMLQAAEFVKDKLISTYPENQELYNNNYVVLSAALEKLNQDYQLMADDAVKPVITTVMLFTYWHERYDIEILSITTDAHSSESNPGDIIEYVNLALEHNIHFILFEKNVNSPAGAQVLQELLMVDLSASALFLHGLGNLTTEEAENGANYITVMYENLEILNSATK
jgi:zinc transport system substrate-binding protein